uniref:PPIase cyclophilin-type domain-containing protein n=1 Tax=Rhizochromulina marina TaxID=1034831 RepID=A0A7S2RJG5_9STRA|mmetsp:Transcript_17255/g.50275  ORF Transcript_17255/g.50275 Transcript_17255/m.50275 type:complete len:343 (+) Transcript_17255:206-1234(+)
MRVTRRHATDVEQGQNPAVSAAVTADLDDRPERPQGNRLLLAVALLMLSLLALYAERAFTHPEVAQGAIEEPLRVLEQLEHVGSRQVLPEAAPPVPAAHEAHDHGRQGESHFIGLEMRIEELSRELRDLKKRKVSLETDDMAQMKIRELQTAAREMVLHNFGSTGPFRAELNLVFPDTMPDFDTEGAAGRIVIELAPLELLPYSNYAVLDMISNWPGGFFHRNAPHVKQVQVSQSRSVKHLPMPFQEYSKEYPHVKYTLGFAGRPGGPAFYVSTVDNTRNHGPGSQSKGTTEADTCFGRVVEGFDVVDRMSKQPGKSKPNGFVSGRGNLIEIQSFRLLAAGG